MGLGAARAFGKLKAHRSAHFERRSGERAMAEAKTKKTSKSKAEPAPAKAYPDTAADRLFREDPFSRLLLLAHWEKKSAAHRGEWGSPRIPMMASAEQARRIKTLRSALEALRVEGVRSGGSGGLEGLGEKEKEELLVALSRDYPGLEGLSFDAMKLKTREYERMSWSERQKHEPAHSAEGKALIQALALELRKSSAPAIADEDLPEALEAGRLELSERCGFDLDLFDALKTDPELSLALCRLAFAGPTELSMVNPKSEGQEGYEGFVKSMSTRHGLDLGLDQLPAEHPLSGVAFPDTSAARPFAELAAAAAAMRAEGEWGERARASLKRLTDTREGSSWDALPPGGDVAYYNPQKQKPAQARRVAGVAARGETARLALAQLAQIASWRTPMSAVEWNPKPGLAYAKVLAKEAAAHQAKAPEALARALEELAARPGLRLEICSAFAARVATGYSALPEDANNDDFFPELADHRESADAKAGPSFNAGEAFAADPMGAVAVATAKALGFTSDTPQALVGEAKRALADSAGLSSAAWKGMSSSPELAKAFEKMLAAVKKPAPARSGALKAAVDIMEAAEANGSAFSAALGACSLKEAKLTAPEAAGRALSAAAMGGVPTEAQTRLLHFLAQNETARLIAAGRLPRMPQGWNGRERYHYQEPGAALGGFEREADKARSLQMDIEALCERGPAMIRGMSERLERARGKAIKAGADEAQASQMAHEQVGALLSDIVDCAAGQPAGFWAGLDKKDPLASGARQHEAWAAHQRELQAQANPSLRKTWRVEAGEMRHGRVEAKELSVGMALFEEGQAMSHCVGSYAERCFSGQSRIFSVRIAGLRQSTLELAPCSKAGGGADIGSFDAEDPAARAKVKGWRVQQNRGKHNATNLSAEIKEACDEFARQYARAFEANTALIIARLKEEREAAATQGSEKPGANMTLKAKAKIRGAVV